MNLQLTPGRPNTTQFADRRIDVLLAAAQAGAAAAVELQGTATVNHKGTFDLVTSGDHASQAAVIEVIKARLPGFEIVAEEKENDATLPASCVVIDPIDGTTRYSKGARDWGILVGLIEAGEPTMGVILQPLTGSSAIAVKGQGCVVEGRVTKFPGTATLGSSVLGADLGSFAGWPEVHGVLKVAYDNSFGVVGVMSVVGNGLELLRQTTGVYVQPGGAKIWDLLPLVVAVREAGGYVCDLDGNSLKLDRIKYGVTIFGSSEAIAIEFVRSYKGL